MCRFASAHDPAIPYTNDCDVLVPNPDIPDGDCDNLDVWMIMDESGSLRGSEAEVEAAFDDFVDAFENTGVNLGIIEFNNSARLVTPPVEVTPASISTVFTPYITNDWLPQQNTNWHDAFLVLEEQIALHGVPDFVVLVTNGVANLCMSDDIPTTQAGHQFNCVGNVAGAVLEARQESERLKMAGTRNLVVGINMNADIGQWSAQSISGRRATNDITGQGINDFDVLNIPSVGALQDALREVAVRVCEPPLDTDGDGVADDLDIDDDDDGIIDTLEGNGDPDGDGIPNRLDLDSDNDGIPDNHEAQSTQGYLPPTDVDSDEDGLDNAYDGPGSGGVSPERTDDDALPDFLDVDSDNDGFIDSEESGLPGAINVDADLDGLDDAIDDMDDMHGSPNAGVADPATALADSDGDATTTGDSDYREPIDTDGDGIPDHDDIDDDNDGIIDTDELGGLVPETDTDGDGIPDWRDGDSGLCADPDGDGFCNALPPAADPDGDGIPNHLDLDADGDGIPDLIENQPTADTTLPTGNDDDDDGLDNAFDGPSARPPEDTDGDDTPDFLDLDSDDDGTPDEDESGLPALTGNDVDDDGLDNAVDPTNGHGPPQGPINDPITDLADSDNDAPIGDVDYRDATTDVDTDGDGTPDVIDPDDDNDGIPDTVEGEGDPDGDGIPNDIDLDADNDGIPDNHEAQPTDGYVPPSGNDSDMDGWDDAYDVDQGGQPINVPQNTDGTDLPDFLDLNSDNDAYTDEEESGLPPLSGIDNDRDGLDDIVDDDPNNHGSPNAGVDDPAGTLADTDGDVNTPNGDSDYRDPEDTDGDGVPDVDDIDDDDDGIRDDDEYPPGVDPFADDDDDGVPDWRDADSDLCDAGDNNDDGICDELSDLVDPDGDGVPNHLDLDADDDGIPDLIESQPTNDTNYPSGNDTDNDGLDNAFEGPRQDPVDTDGTDGPDFLDTDSDGDGMPDEAESGQPTLTGGDNDDDGLDNAVDPDDDNHGPAQGDINDPTTDLADSDGDVNAPDGDVDYRDTDDAVDTDGDGTPDVIDPDDDNDGIPDDEEGSGDPDGDGVPNSLDLDADNDGIPDNLETQSTFDYIPPTGSDSDMDGIDDAYDPQGGTPLGDPEDTDGDGTPDYLDPNSDNDEFSDTEESGLGPLTGEDDDSDGLDDGVDDDPSNWGSPNASLDDPAEDLADEDDDADTRSGDSDYREASDKDGDGDPDSEDIDDDNDGIPDIEELGGLDPDADSDDDGIPDWRDADSPECDVRDRNGDGICDELNADIDPDGDGVPNHLDIDADNDGITDLIEAQPTDDTILPTGLDSDDDGLDNAYDGANSITPEDTDGDDTPDYLDDDSDDDGTPDVDESGLPALGTVDADEDGLLDGADADPATQGPPQGLVDDPTTGLADSDGDVNAPGGDVDYRDDSAAVDTDGDGTPDITDPDDDNDGILDDDEPPGDPDGDGVPSDIDLDSDNDGIPDNIEGQTTDDYIPPSGVDADMDGIDDAYDPTEGGTPVGTPNDDDDDDIPDFLDLDSDGDGVTDTEESGLPPLSGDDDDNDGLDDAVDDDPTAHGSPNAGIDDPATAMPDEDGDVGTPPDGDVDFRDPVDTDGDGVPDKDDADDDDDGILDIDETGGIDPDADDDGDGIPDWRDADDPLCDAGDANNDGVCDEPPAAIDPDGDGVPNHLDLDADNDGIPDLVESQPTDDTVFPTGTDSDGDGVDDAFDGPGTIVPEDTDGDDTPDYLDTDSDDDGVADVIESGQGPLSGNDSDGDGLDDNVDDEPDVHGRPQGLIDDPLTDLADSDNDAPLGGDVDYRDAVTDVDTDGDGIPDSIDEDDDNDGIPDDIEGELDPDGDGNPNRIDLDADDDGIPDNLEAQPTDGYVPPTGNDHDNDGLDDAYDGDLPTGVALDMPENSDDDFIADFLDTDSDNDGLPDQTESGLPDLIDADRDNDGLDDAVDTDDSAWGPINADLSDPANDLADEDGDAGTPGGDSDYREPKDTDGDGTPDADDPDDDNDGILDTDELGFDPDGDADNDGIPDWLDADAPGCSSDADDDGVCDTPPDAIDPDGDGIPNHLDLDADDDGIPDVVESQPTDAYIAPSGIDDDMDGLDDAYDPSEGGMQVTPQQTDTDGVPDYLDTDADDDGILDENESGLPPLTGSDADGDGLDNAADDDPNGFGPADGLVPDPTLLPDADGDLPAGGDVDYRDATFDEDTDGDGVPDSSDIDDDDDGILDVVEGDEDPDEDGIPNRLDLDSDNDGIPDNHEGQPTDGYMPPSDSDIDRDGLDDAYESNGVIPQDTDRDTVPDYLDPDSDGDGYSDVEESGLPAPTGTDGDEDGLDDIIDDDPTAHGSPNAGVDDPASVLADTDGDVGTPGGDSDYRDPVDTDGDGVPDPVDPDDDDDGVLDVTELGDQDPDEDTDGDGISDWRDADDPGCLVDLDGDGICDLVPVEYDADGDGIPNHLDLDSDNDGLPDVVEAQPTLGFVEPLGTDGDGDGLDDAFDPGLGNSPLFPVDTDGDNIPDILDEDSDDDGAPDQDESGLATLSGIDDDNDGLDDAVDDNPAGFGRAKGVIDNPATDLRDTDGDVLDPDGDVDYRDDTGPQDCDGDGLLDEQEDLNGNGIVDDGETDPCDGDTDNDGLTDFEEPEIGTDPLNPDTDEDGIQDGTELGIVDPTPYTEISEFIPDSDPNTTTDPLDDDTDDDGLLDGTEDANGDGETINDIGGTGTPGSGETDPLDPDTDGDGLPDGLEDGLTEPEGDDTDRGVFLPDTDPDTTTDPLDTDTDDGSVGDGAEDIDSDGSVDANEIDPLDGSDDVPIIDTDGDGLPDDCEDANGNGIVDPGETDPLNPDSDGDGLNDGLEDADGDCELDEDETDPLNPNTDGCDFDDGDEVLVTLTDPLKCEQLQGSGCSSSGGAPAGFAGLLLTMGALLGRRRRRRSAVAAAALAAAAVVTTTTDAAAQDDGPRIDAQRFDPVPQGPTFTMVRDARQDERGTFNVDFNLNYALNPLELGLTDSQERTAGVMDNLLGGDVRLNYAPFDWLQLGVSVPVFQAQFNSDRSNLLQGALGGNQRRVGLGDMHLAIGLALLREKDNSGVSLSLTPRISFPTGARRQFLGSDAFGIGGDLALGKSWDFFRFSAMIGYQYLTNSQALLNVYADDELRFGLGVGIPFSQGKWEVEGEWYGGAVLTPEGREALGEPWRTSVHLPMEILVGLLHVPEKSPVWFKVGAGPGLTHGFGTPDVRVFGTVGLQAKQKAPPPRVDTDGDGYYDDEDECPLEPEDFDGFEDAEGCPDPDNDQDGVLDVVDGWVGADGTTEMDPSYPDFGNCMNNPEDKDGFEDEEGCPDPDNDNDGIPDVEDGARGPGDKVLTDPNFPGYGNCMNEPEDRDGFDDTDGCPDTDNDKDGVPDVEDGHRVNGVMTEFEGYPGFGDCMNDPEDFAESTDHEDGCPAATIKCGEGLSVAPIFFDYNKATIKSVSYPVLDAVVALMEEYEDYILLMEVQGHTDVRGSDSYNLDLSDRRAASVMRYLTSHGVESWRLQSRGYGERVNIFPNAQTEEEHATNRRVEFVFLKVNEGECELQVETVKPGEGAAPTRPEGPQDRNSPDNR